MDNYRPPPCSVFIVKKSRKNGGGKGKENVQEKSGQVRINECRMTCQAKEEDQERLKDFEIEKEFWIQRWLDSLVPVKSFQSKN